MWSSNLFKNKESVKRHEKLQQSGDVWKGTKTSNPQIFTDLKEFPELKTSKTATSSSVFNKNSTTHHNIVNKNINVNEKNEFLKESFPVLGDVRKRTEESKRSETVAENSKLGVIQDASGVKKKDGGNPNQPRKNPFKKKRSDPIYINLQDFKVKREFRKKNHITKPKLKKKEQQLSGNILDSSNPKRSKGKFREIKKIKLTSFKKSIIKERIIKQKLKELAVSAYYGDADVNIIDDIDFKSEIKTYLSQQKEKKNSDEIKKNESSKCVKKATKDKKLPQVSNDGKIQFTSKFREYCDNIITKDLNNSVSELITELIKLQDRQFLRDPIKAKAKRRHVSGIREIKKHLTLKKVKMILIAPNLEKIQIEGGVFDSIAEIKSIADSQNVIYGFALDRYGLGRVTKKNVPVSAFAILNYEGLEKLYDAAKNQLVEAKIKFKELVEPKEAEVDDVNTQVINSLISAIKEDLHVSEGT